ncbi:uncharacterized protein MONOS_2799 [Monocercomonoides exilis]|uniref:uncharacterized protein n=1 Tax=Monocercomonoides exilis TaxID=2049356 RepID=UPI00355A8421|nr:hypothetical protein MONOS_2799 [Monocercomonoides exilis]|eukprot:MONOS_2799.1-p1 / transcript=MONOS_2799.1 / gene=MONOS_2799 / organism=Monocercomonoides_exilis_PA203 / gene_product=unspecified product / transcript_product=unspecified product / location=Mono_scaffold00060:55302-56219(+) / protein_length=151 / sequence_SO=supercontig / SO=protein_coding / is_pseudo=false
MISTSLRPTPQRPQESLTIRVKASTFLFILLLFMMLVLGAALTGFIAYFAGCGTTIRSECEMPLSDIQRIMLFVYHYNGAAYAQRRAEDIFTNTSLLLTGFEPPEGDERDKELMASKNKQKQKMSRNDKTGNKEPKRIIPLFYESDYDLA